MSIRFFSGGQSTYATDPVPAVSRSSVTRSRWLIGSSPPTLNTSPSHASRGAGPQERVGGIVDVDEVAQLRAVAEDLDLASLDREPDEPADEALAVVLDQLPRAVDVGQPQRGGAHAEDVVVEQVVVLARRLVDAVDVGGPDQMVSRRRAAGPAGRRPAACRRTRRCTVGLCRRQASSIDSCARQLISRSVYGSRMLSMWLTCPARLKITSRSCTSVVHRRSSRTSATLTRTRSSMPCEVEPVAAVLRDQGIDDQDVGAGRDQRAREVAADEAQAARDHHAPAAVEIEVGRRSRAISRPRRRVGAGGRIGALMLASDDERRTRASSRRWPS